MKRDGRPQRSGRSLHMLRAVTTVVVFFVATLTINFTLATFPLSFP